MKKICVYALILVIPLSLLIVGNLPMQQMPGAAFMDSGGAYVNTEHLFTLNPPRGWEMTEKFSLALAHSGVVAFELREPGGFKPLKSMMGVSGNARANIMVRMWRWATTVDKVISFIKRPNPVVSFKIKSEGPMTVGHVEGYRLHYSWGPYLDLAAGEHVENYVAWKDRLFLVSYMTFGDVRFDAHFQEAEAAIRSFRFLERVTVDVVNGSVLVDGKRYDKLPTTLYLTVDEPHTLVALHRRSIWRRATGRNPFAGWSDGHASPSRTVVIHNPQNFMARFVAP